MGAAGGWPRGSKPSLGTTGTGPRASESHAARRPGSACAVLTRRTDPGERDLAGGARAAASPTRLAAAGPPPSCHLRLLCVGRCHQATPAAAERERGAETGLSAPGPALPPSRRARGRLLCAGLIGRGLCRVCEVRLCFRRSRTRLFHNSEISFQTLGSVCTGIDRSLMTRSGDWLFCFDSCGSPSGSAGAGATAGTRPGAGPPKHSLLGVAADGL